MENIIKSYAFPCDSSRRKTRNVVVCKTFFMQTTMFELKAISVFLPFNPIFRYKIQFEAPHLHGY